MVDAVILRRVQMLNNRKLVIEAMCETHASKGGMR